MSEKQKTKMTTMQKISLNIKIVILIIVIILVGFFAAYMFKTTLDDVLTRESYDSAGASVPTVTTVYEQGGEESEDSGATENSQESSQALE